MGVQGGELLAQMKGLIEGGGMDGLRFAWKNLKAGEALPLDPNAVARSKVGQLGKAWSADTWGASQNGIVGKSLDVFNFFSTLPGRSLVGADAYFKSIGYRMGLRQWAARTAGQEAASGKIRPDMLKGREAQLLADPPPEMLEAGRLNADYQTFNNTPGRFATWINLGRQWFPGMNLLMPFVRTPANIMNYALGQRTPLALFTRQLYADMAAGGARAEIAAARLSTGTMIANLAYNAALNGWVTGKGPDDQNMAAAYRRIGRQPYSIRNADGRWFSFSRTDPAGVTLGQAADLAELLHNTDFDPKDTKSIESVIDAYIGAAINQTMNKSYLSSFSQFMEFTQSASTHFSTYMLGGLVPAGVAQAARGMDPVQREVDGAIDNLKARTPGLSQTLPPRLDMWGRPMSYQSGIGWAWDLFSPVYSRKENPEPIDRQIIMHDWSIPEPSKTMQFPGSVSINLGNYPHVWSYWKHMQGQDPGPTGHNLIDTLNGMVLGMGDIPEASAYAMRTTDGANSGKEQMVKQVIADFRQRATLGLINTPLNQVPRAVQGELTQLRAEYRRKVSQRPGTLIGVPPPPVRGVPMENQLP
jgi:hypothetical protein